MSISAVGAARPPLTPAIAVAVLALLVRLVYLYDVADYPAFSIPIVDSLEYHNAAREWVGGGGMSPHFFWQPFFYPFFLSGVYLLNDGFVIGTKAIQVLLGAVTCGLTCRLGQRMLTTPTGVVAGCITAFYGPLIFYDAELLATGWAAFWSVTLLLVFLAAQRRPSFRVCLALGVIGALSVLTRPTFLPFFVAGCLWLGWHLLRGSTIWTQRLANGSAVLLGFALVSVPVAAQARRVTGHFGFLPASGGINVYVGNHPDTDMVADTVALEWEQLQRMPEREGIRDTRGKQRYFYQQTWAYIRDDPAGFLQRLLHKTLQLVSGRELPRNVNIYDIRRWSSLQTLLTWKAGAFGFPFGALFPLALVGLISAGRRLPAVYWLFLILYPSAVVLVFVTARYRVPIVPALSIAAAGGIIAFIDLLRERRWMRFIAATAVVTAGVLAATLPGPFSLESPNYELGLDVAIGRYYHARGDVGRAREFYERELERNPDSFWAHTELGGLDLQQRARLPMALGHFNTAVRLKPHLAAAYNNRGLVLFDLGRTAEAIEDLRKAIAIEPSVARFHAGLGAALLDQDEPAAALDAHREAVRVEPENPVGYVNLGITLAKLRRFEAAIETLRHALSLDPDDVHARFMLAQALQDAGRIDQAVVEYQIILRLEPGHRAARQRLERLQQSPRGG